MNRQIKHLRVILLATITLTLFFTGADGQPVHAFKLSLEKIDAGNPPQIKAYVKATDEEQKLVPGLSKGDFTVQVDSTAITDFQVRRGFGDAEGMLFIILVDTSDNWRDSGFETAQVLLSQFKGSLAPEDRVLVFASDRPQYETELRDLKESTDDTAIYDAIVAVLDNPAVKNAKAEPSGRKQMLVISSGKTKDDRTTIAQCSIDANKSGVTVNVVTVNAKDELKELKGLSQALGGKYFETPTGGQLKTWSQEKAEVKDRYIFQFTAPDTAPAEHTLTIGAKDTTASKSFEVTLSKEKQEDIKIRFGEGSIQFQNAKTKAKQAKTKTDYAAAKTAFEEAKQTFEAVLTLAGGTHEQATARIKEVEEEVQQLELDEKFEAAKGAFNDEQAKDFDERDYKANVLPKFEAVKAHSEAAGYIQQVQEKIKAQTEIKGLFNNGKAFYDQKKYSEAIVEFTKALERDNTYKKAADYIKKSRQKMEAQAAFDAGEQFLKDEKYKEALAEFKKALSSDPDNPEIKKKIEETEPKLSRKEKLDEAYSRGEEHFREKKYREALSAFREVKDIDPTYGDVEKRIGECEANIDGDAAFDEAVKAFEAAKESQDEEDHDRAIDAFEKAKKRFEALPETYHKRDEVTDYIEKSDEAIRGALYNRAEELMLSRDYKDALERLERLERDYPDYKKTVVARLKATCKKELGGTKPSPPSTASTNKLKQFNAAKKAFDDEDYADAKAKFEVLKEDFPDYKKSEVATYIVRADEKLSRAMYEQAIALYREQKYAEAKVKFEELQTEYPEHNKSGIVGWIKDCRFGEAEALYKSEKYGDAKEAFLALQRDDAGYKTDAIATRINDCRFGEAEKLSQNPARKNEAKEAFLALQREHPDYNPDTVASRIKALKPGPGIWVYAAAGSVGLLAIVGVLTFVLTRPKRRHCPICGREMDASWSHCLFCEQQTAQPAATPQVQPYPAIAQPAAPTPPLGNPTMRLMVGGARLVVRQGGGEGLEYPLEGNAISIGRDENANEIVLNDDAVSRIHAEIKFQGGKFVIKDQGGANGTFVNGSPIDLMQLENGDDIQIGRTVLQFQVGQ
jgi:tetratricopeptide (TPR) repeat protein